MKKLIVLGLMLIGTASFAQNKNAKATLEVDGVCMMCKTRIEKASIKTKGVKVANWDVKTHMLSLVFDERKTNLEKIKETENLKLVKVQKEDLKDLEKKRIEEIFADKTVVVFSLPGAFTPTCSSNHLPRYNELAPRFFDNGVDEILCVSVNDTFVMNAWAEDQQAEHISFIPDGNGEFTRGMGMLVDKNDLGFGQRSWRYAMLVKNGIIEKMFIEPDLPGDPFEVSDADTMLAHINPQAVSSKEVTVISKPGCPYCVKAKALLAEQGLAFEELVLGEQLSISAMRAMTKANTVPQIFIDGQHIGGSDHLAAYFN